MENNNVDKNYEYYKKEFHNLKKEYNGKYIIIQDEKVLYANESFEKIISFAKKLQAGTYIIQEVKKDIESSIRVFHSRVRLNG